MNPLFSYISPQQAMAELRMASSVHTSKACLLLLLVLLLGSANYADGAGRKNVLKLNLRSFLEQKTAISNSSSTSRCLSQRSRQRKDSIVLEIIHKDHCSGQKTSWIDKAEKTLISDDAHVRYLHSRMKPRTSPKKDGVSEAQIPLTSGIKLQTLNYIVSVGLGGRKMNVIVDTGSDLTWVQCQPCRACYIQQDPLFNPSVSPSYKSVSCNSSTCQSLLFETGNSGICSGMAPQMCNYVVSYGDGSYTRGELGVETLNLGTASVSNFVFGCGRSNKGLFGGASGLMGLGRSSLSLVSQTSAMFGGVFSYCLPSAEAAAAGGSLAFGADSSVYKNSTPISYTDIIPNPQLGTFYFLNLTRISIGGVALDSPSFGKAGILIDSGTVITRLPPSMYKALKTEFITQFSGYPSAPGFSILDTCFNLSSYQEVEIPEMKMHFGGDAEMVVDVMGIFYFAKSDASQVCLAVASLSYEDGVGIIGNYQQKNQRVIYDTKGNKLGFAKETCSFM